MTQGAEPGDAPAGTSGGLAVPTGYRVAGWEVTGPIGAGNRGSVYAAQRPANSGEPALKFLTTGHLPPRQVLQLAESARREADFCRRGGGARLIGVLDTTVVDDPANPELDGAVVLVLERAARSLFNVEGDCRALHQRLPACSMGRARDPRQPYDARSVVSHRVWHDDVLTADCVVYDAERWATRPAWRRPAGSGCRGPCPS